MQWESYLQKIQLWIPSLTVENDVRGAVIPALCRDRFLCHPSPTLVRGDNVKSTVYAISTALDPIGFYEPSRMTPNYLLPTAYYNSSYLEVPKARPHTFIKSINFAHDNVKAEVTVWRQSRDFSLIPRKLCRLAVGCSPMFWRSCRISV